MTGRRLLPFSPKGVGDWPTSDQAGWSAARVGDDPLEEPGAAARWAPETSRAAVNDYGNWLAWLDREGMLDTTTAPAARVTPDRVRSYLDFLNSYLAPISVASMFQRMVLMIEAIHPGGDVFWLKAPVIRLLARATPTRSKTPKLFDSDHLYQTGLDMMAAATPDAYPHPRTRALAYRDGLLIAFLAARPIRVGNLTAMSLNRHVLIDGDVVNIRFDSDEVKTRRPLEFPWPAVLVEPLHVYLSVHRPALLDTGPTEALWLSRVGPMTLPGMKQAIAAATKRSLGVALNPHIFRDCAATTVAFKAPEEVMIIMTILGHSSLRTSQRHYNHATTVAASKRHQAIINEARNEGNKLYKRRRRRVSQ